jgi:hypothetical protein
MRDLTDREVRAVALLRAKFSIWLGVQYPHISNGNVLDLIRYAKRLKLSSKKG